jgi:NADPH:quinone reductase-like Zn-dependent oxidoreductase
MTVRGVYGRKPKLPATPGYEGVGIVEKNGGGLLGWRVAGRRVAVLNGLGGNWAEYVVIPARQAVPLPKSIPDNQAASFFVNPATALIMTTRVLKVPRGEWLLQTAAASALGQMVVRLGKHFGFRTLNVVRRQEAAEQLLKLGADAVVNTERENLLQRVKEITVSKGISYAIDCVGGELGSDVIRTLAPGGRMLFFGTLSDDPLRFSPRDLMTGSKRVEGFWLSDWVRQQNPLTMLFLFRQVGQLIDQGLLTSPVGDVFSMDKIGEAVQQAMQPGHGGKMLLKIAER